LPARRVGERSAPATGPATTRLVCLLFGHCEIVNANEIGWRLSTHERHEAFWLPVKAVFVSNCSTAQRDVERNRRAERRLASEKK
jgi:hypothetical protein